MSSGCEMLRRAAAWQTRYSLPDIFPGRNSLTHFMVIPRLFFPAFMIQEDSQY